MNALSSFKVWSFSSVLENTSFGTQMPWKTSLLFQFWNINVTLLTSLSVLVRVFMLMFSFMLCRLNRKSYLSLFYVFLSQVSNKVLEPTRSCRGWTGCQIFDQLHWSPGSWSGQSENNRKSIWKLYEIIWKLSKD